MACGEAAAGPSTLPSLAGNAAVLQLQVEIRGALSGSARLTQSAGYRDCTAFALGSGRRFIVPSGTSTASVGGQPFAIDASVTDYHGPGVYKEHDFGDPTTTTLTVDLSSSQIPFEPVGPGAAETLTVRGDGSGVFTFNDWQDSSLRIESGTVTWTCQYQGG